MIRRVSIHNSQLPWIFGANLLFVTSLYAGKEWLLDFDVGVFWVVMRILACGGIGALVWEGLTGQFAKRRTIEASLPVHLDSHPLTLYIFTVVCSRNVVALALRAASVFVHSAIQTLYNSVCHLTAFVAPLATLKILLESSCSRISRVCGLRQS